MRAHGVDGGEEDGGDRLAVEPARYACENPRLLTRELSDELLGPALPQVVVEQLTKHIGEQARRDPRLAPHRAADGAAEVGGAHLLGNERQGPGTQGRARGVWIVVTRDHHDPQRGTVLAQRERQVDAVVGTQLDVEDGDVGTQHDRGAHGRGGGARAAHHIDAGLDGETRGQRLRERHVVVDDQDPRRFHRNDDRS
jgi:hypothetical protein